MPHLSVMGTLLLGFVLGLRHALDADHLAAVATIMGGRGGLLRSMQVGLFWGLGHALALGAVGGTLVALRIAVPERIGLLFELAVCLMLIGLGTAALAVAFRQRMHAHRHAHDCAQHAHLHVHPLPHAVDGPEVPAHRHPQPVAFALRPFLIGSLHGLAGTGALVLLVLTTLPTVLIGLLYVVIFGVGSVAGMGIMSVVLGAPLMVASRRAAWLYGTLRAAAGLGSLLLGIVLAWRIVSGPAAGP